MDNNTDTNEFGRKIGIQISEEMSRSTNVLPTREYQFNKMLDEMNVQIDRKPMQTKVHLELTRMVEELMPQGKQILQDATNQSRIKFDISRSWRELLKWDKSIPCPEQGCNQIVLKSTASNTVELWDFVYDLIKNLFNENKILIDKEKWFTEDEKTQSLMSLDGLSKIINYHDRSIHWPAIRSTIKYILFEECTEVKVGDILVDISDFETKESEFSELELKVIQAKNKKIAGLCHLLNICDSDPLQCPSCGHNLFWNERQVKSDKEFDFETTSRLAIETSIRCIVGSAVNRPPKKLIGRIDGKKIEILRGKIASKSSDRLQRAISESVLVCNSVVGEFEVPYGDKSITFNPEDNQSQRVYSAINTRVVEELSRELKKLKPLAFFLLEDEGVIDWDNWGGNTAISILQAFSLAGFVIRDDKTYNFLYHNGEAPKRDTVMLNLTNEINKEVRDRFTEKSSDGGTYNALEFLLNRDTTYPMFSLPVDRSLNYPGGFMTPHMQSRYPLVSNNSIEDLLNIVRFEPSLEAINAINNLQKTEWKIDNKVKDITFSTLKNFVQETLVEKFAIREVNPKKKVTAQALYKRRNRKSTKELNPNSKPQEIKEILNVEWNNLDALDKKEWENKAISHNTRTLLCLDMKCIFPTLTLGQVTTWNASLSFIEKLNLEFEKQSNQTFWHAWSFDWRGRMVTSSTLLSPQSDDFSRGMLRFAESHALTSIGWEWLQIHTAKLMRGRALPENLFSAEQLESWKQIQKTLQEKTHQANLKVSKDPLFIEILEIISNSPMKYYSIWGKGDVFLAKSEGFQRISAIITFVEAHQGGGEGTNVCLPISQDASSSIYQQTSLLVRDKQMAELVNVVQVGNHPQDVYLEVINNLEKAWGKNPSFPGELSPDQITNLMKVVLDRGVAKKPVMTIGYGATESNMVKSLLTHNGKESGLHGGIIPVWKSDYKIVDEISQASKDEWSWRMTAHPSSTLYPALVDINPELHDVIARKIIKDMKMSVEQVLPGYGVLRTNLEEIAKQMPIGADAPDPVEWQLPDGTLVRNIKMQKEQPATRSYRKGIESSSTRARRIAVEAMEEMRLPNTSSIPLSTSMPIDFSNIPNELKESEPELFEVLMIAEKKRFETILSELSNLEMSGYKLYKHYTKNSIKKSNKEASSKEINDKILEQWKELDEQIKEEWKEQIEMIKTDNGISLSNLSVNWKTFRSVVGIVAEDKPLLEHEINALPDKIKRAVRRFFGTVAGGLSRRQLTSARKLRGEISGLSPNFVHSHDACHMRLVVNDLFKSGIHDIWSVHDAFGCHPNYIGKMIELVKTNLLIVHKEVDGARGTLDKLMKKHLGTSVEGELKLSEVGSDYFIQ
ncbi:MAG: hypothetical protein QGI21_06855 [Candidatus Poseidoniaceae archaeon]|jgi:hypothetical protein|nr:hypothetical protein [Candidatus Poseidoniaceae archaeon]